MNRDLAMALRLNEYMRIYSSYSTRVHIRQWQRRQILSYYRDWEQGWKSKGILEPIPLLPRHKFVNVDK
jgi:hypothetical protein